MNSTPKKSGKNESDKGGGPLVTYETSGEGKYMFLLLCHLYAILLL